MIYNRVKLIALYLLIWTTSSALSVETTQNILQTTNNKPRNAEIECPRMLQHVFENAAPRYQERAGVFKEFTPPTIANENPNNGGDDDLDLTDCIVSCCEKDRLNNTCNLVFVFKRKCYHVSCATNEGCLPYPRENVKERLQMILVNPVLKPNATAEEENATWLDILKASKSDSAETGMLSSFPIDEINNAGGGDGGSGEEFDMNRLSFWNKPHKYHYSSKSQQDPSGYDDDEFPIADKRMKQLLMSQVEDETNGNLTPEELAFYNTKLQLASPNVFKLTPCELVAFEGSRHTCPQREECMPLQPDTLSGVCKCIHGYIRNQLGKCVPQELDYSILNEANSNNRRLMMEAASEILPVSERKKEELQSDSSGSASTLSLTENSMQSESNKKIIVSVVSKEVRLPEKEVTLAAYVMPDEQTSATKYKYLWTLITQPKGPMNGTISDQSQSKVKLSNLSEGLYTFKVSVTGANGTSGETMANVTVLPEKRVNRVPQVIITPKEQIIQQPTTNAILDGSTSSDDDNIVSWHWEVVQGPIGYQPKLPEVNTLQLTDLSSPGNYTFKLTVTDSDNVKNSTTANITVLKVTDYPPVANAGDAVILYLPNNNVTLNGTASSDDHEIVEWEWTKDASDEAKAVDMQNTRTPYVQLSNLEEGMYTFVLKVTDGSKQSSTAKVHVFVKPQTNSPPVAVAGGNMTLNLPLNWVILNGSRSTDDIKIESFLWQQKSGPNTAVIRNSNTSVANATSLTLGLYEFVLSVTDENNNTASDSMWVKVTQEKNAPPVANAGGDQSVTLPISALYLNGTKSSDDLAVVKYIWTREDASLAAGLIVGETNKEAVLILTNLVHGRYVFKLTVSDEQGLTASDTVSVNVRQDPLIMNLVELTLPMGASVLTQGELNTIIQKVGLLLGDMKIHVREMKYTRLEGTILIFHAEAANADGIVGPVQGLVVEQLLKEKLQRDASILGTVIVDVRTTICQNNCSKHGVCNAVTRACICEAFWMPSVSYFWGFSEANCDWSILYVFVSLIVLFLMLSGLFWGIACACRKRKKKSTRSRPKVQKYSLIGTQDEEAPHFGRASSLTDSETDSDVLFETRTKPNGILRANGAIKNKHNHHISGSNGGGSGSIGGAANNKYSITKLGRKIKT